MRTLKLMPDYYCFPLWETLVDGLDNINHYTLSISNDLKTELDLWADKYDATLNKEDPSASKFESQSKEEAFWKEGYDLLERLNKELKGQNFNIISSF